MNIKRFATFLLAVCILTGIVAQPPQSASAASVEVMEGGTGSTQELKTASAATGSAVKKDAKNTKAAKAGKAKEAKASGKSYSKAELRLMASIINCEAGIESYQGKLAVGVVVMNRVKSKQFPNTIRGVIYERGQFSPVRNGSLKRRLRQYDAGRTGSKQWKSCIKAAKAVLKGQRTIIYKGKVKSMSGYHFFSVYLPKARMKLGGHRFK